ncbi:MAG: hypothetical protein J6N76_10155, partial [Lachnospiraceae bacterium]|nr:hypothetical protein [Lachnospiraceae bacterium]
VDRLENQYKKLQEEEEKLGIDQLSAEVEKLRETTETLKEGAREGFYTDEEKQKIESIKKRTNDEKKVISEINEHIEKQYEKLGGEEKQESLKIEIERMKLSEKDRLTDELVNDELTRQKIRLYQKNRAKYDRIITFAEVKEVVDKDAIVAEEEEDAVQWTADEEELKDLIADLIYDKNTWESDEKRNDPAGQVAGILSSHTELLLKILMDPSIVDRFFDKLPLDPSSELINRRYVSILTGEETEDSFKESLKKNFKEFLDKQLMSDKTIKEYIDKLNDIKKQIEEAKREVEEEKERLAKEKGEKEAGFGDLFNAFLGGFGLNFKKSPLEKAEEKLEDLESSLSNNTFLAENGMALFISGAKDMIAPLVNDLQKTLDQYMNDETLQKNIEECVDGLISLDDTQKTDTKSIPDPRDKKLSKEEKEDAIKRGNDALIEIIQESMQGSEGQGKFIKNIMKNYMTGVTKLDVRSMMSSAIRNLKPVDPTLDAKEFDEEKRIATYSSFLGGALKGAGPLLQKMLQGIPDQMVPAAFKSSIKDMKSNLAPIPEEVVRAELASIIERSNGKILSIKVQKSLGAASVGQAFLCKLSIAGGANEDVVIKILRPDVRNKMQREKAVMLKSAKEAGDGMYHSYKGMLNVYEDELDLTLEAKNCEHGDIYNTGGDVKSMKVLDTVAPSTNSMVVEKADGVTIDSMLESMKSEYEAAFGKYFERDEKGNIIYDGGFPKLNIDARTPGLGKIQRRFSDKLKNMQKAQKRMVKLAEKWVQEGVFGSGFYHGDLHAGNIMNGNHYLTVIDYGNATQLTPMQQTEITRMMVAAAAGDMEGFRDGFKKLLLNTSEEEYQKKKPQLSEAIKEVFRLGDKRSAGQRIAAALMKAQQLGFEIPTSVYNFSQCELRLQNTIDDMNEQIKKYKNALGKIEGLGKLESADIVSNLNDIEHNSVREYSVALYAGRSDENIRELIREKDIQKREKVFSRIFMDFSHIGKFLNADSVNGTLHSSIINGRGDVFSNMLRYYKNN